MMDGAALFAATVPVLRHYLGRLDALVAAASSSALERRLADDVFPAGVQFRTAQSFALRTVFPTLGRTVPKLTHVGQTAALLAARSDEVRGLLAPLAAADFDGAADRPVTHAAGEATLTQPGADYALRFALPNFFFHLTMGYATLRGAGLALGKADFDGLHAYAPGFRF
ncbi:MAG: DUF1993 domain-containing protein [Rhodobacteraceae bacterium]|jgi:hypothetical protein|nr:DUF1993 domain-containing protein [Paracoccaceae bacterium]